MGTVILLFIVIMVAAIYICGQTGADVSEFFAAGGLTLLIIALGIILIIGAAIGGC